MPRLRAPERGEAEQVPQERGVPDPDRDPAGVRGPAARGLRASPRPRRRRSTSSLQDIDDGQVTQATIKVENHEVNVDPQGRQAVHHRLPEDYASTLTSELAAARTCPSTVKGDPGLAVVVVAHLARPVRPVHRLLDLPDEPHAGRRLEGDELRQEPGQANVGGRARRSPSTTSPAPTRRSRSCTRSRSSSRTPRSSRASARASRRASCSSAPRAPARPCWRGRWPARPGCPSSRSRARTSSRCSSASARAACATSSSRPSRTRPASSSWTRSTRSAATAARASAAATTSASRR